MSGLALITRLQLGSSSIHKNEELAEDVKRLERWSRDDNLSFREKKHAEAAVLCSQGNSYGAALTWEDILTEHPRDIHALRMATQTYFVLGRYNEIRDSVARVTPFWSLKETPLKNYLHGMYAYGLVESNSFKAAEFEAKKGLQLNRHDAWATHALAHVYDTPAKTREGIDFLTKTENEWSVCNHLANHNYWHWALYHLDDGNIEATTDILEREVLPRALKNRGKLDIHDSTSLLFRMGLNDESAAGKHWENVYGLCQPQLKDHISSFHDCHIMFACIGSKHFAEAEEIIKDFEDNKTSISGREYIVPLLKAIYAYGREDYKTAVDLLKPIRYDLRSIGGSRSQQDVFNQLLIVSALKSNSSHHLQLAEQLIIEREAKKPDSLMNKHLRLRLKD